MNPEIKASMRQPCYTPVPEAEPTIEDAVEAMNGGKGKPDPKRTIPPKPAQQPGRDACPVCQDSGYVFTSNGMVDCPRMPHPTGR
jgi:hypothetical protein